MAVPRLYWFCAWAVRRIGFPLLGGFTVRNKDKVPKEGACIIAPVHFSYLDPPAMGGAVPRYMTVMGKKELFDHFWLGMLLRGINVFPVERGTADKQAIVISLDCLRNNGALLMFPEGTRGNGETLGAIEPGVITFARKTGAKIVPVGITGTQISLPKGASKFKRKRTFVIFGDPFTYAEVAQGQDQKEKDASVASYLAHRLVELCREGGLELKISPDNEGSAPASLPAGPTETIASETP